MNNMEKIRQKVQQETPESGARQIGEVVLLIAAASEQAAEARADAALARLEKVKNPAAHKVNFLFGELCEYWRRLQEAMEKLEQSDAEAAEKMRGAIMNVMGGWRL